MSKNIKQSNENNLIDLKLWKILLKCKNKVKTARRRSYAIEKQEVENGEEIATLNDYRIHKFFDEFFLLEIYKILKYIEIFFRYPLEKVNKIF